MGEGEIDGFNTPTLPLIFNNSVAFAILAPLILTPFHPLLFSHACAVIFNLISCSSVRRQQVLVYLPS